MAKRDLYQEGVAVYERDGQAACEEFARENGVTDTGYCPACQNMEPMLNGACFVCGTAFKGFALPNRLTFLPD